MKNETIEKFDIRNDERGSVGVFKSLTGKRSYIVEIHTSEGELTWASYSEEPRSDELVSFSLRGSDLQDPLFTTEPVSKHGCDSTDHMLEVIHFQAFYWCGGGANLTPSGRQEILDISNRIYMGIGVGHPRHISHPNKRYFLGSWEFEGSTLWLKRKYIPSGSDVVFESTWTLSPPKVTSNPKIDRYETKETIVCCSPVDTKPLSETDIMALFKEMRK